MTQSQSYKHLHDSEDETEDAVQNNYSSNSSYLQANPGQLLEDILNEDNIIIEDENEIFTT